MKISVERLIRSKDHLIEHLREFCEDDQETLRIANEISLKSMDIAEIARDSFPELTDLNKANEWIYCNIKAFPRMQYFTASIETGALTDVAGYALWVERGGYRHEAVFELQQMAVKKELRAKGIGSELLQQSFEEIKKGLLARGDYLKMLLVTTRDGNFAESIYEKILGVKTEITVKDAFGVNDELIMIGRY